MEYNFTGKVVLISGAAGILGQAAARAFMDSGAKLALVDRQEHRLGNLYPDWTDTSRVLLINQMDLNNPLHSAIIVERTRENFNRLDILVNTAGGFRGGTRVHETPVETWDLLMSLNARTAFVLSRAVIPTMLEQKSGKIIHVAAAAGLKGSAGNAAYSASKSALIRLTESLSAELKPHGVNVNCMLPVIIDTPSNRQAMPGADFSKWTKADSLARVILFLASDDANDLHGTAIPL